MLNDSLFSNSSKLKIKLTNGGLHSTLLSPLGLDRVGEGNPLKRVTASRKAQVLLRRVGRPALVQVLRQGVEDSVPEPAASPARDAGVQLVVEDQLPRVVELHRVAVVVVVARARSNGARVLGAELDDAVVPRLEDGLVLCLVAVGRQGRREHREGGHDGDHWAVGQLHAGS